MFHSGSPNHVRLVSLIGLVLCGGLLGSAEEPSTTAADWPAWRGPFGNSCTTTAEPLAAGWSAEQMKPAWEVRFPGTPAKDNRDQFASAGSPVVAQGRVYIHAFVVTAETRKRLEAAGRLDDLKVKDPPTDGEPIRTLWIGCFDADSGTPVWERSFPNHEAGWLTSGTPCVDGGRFFLHTSPGGIVCLDAATGADLWNIGRWSGPSPGGYGDHGTLQACNGVVAIGSDLILDASSGKVIRDDRRNKGATSYGYDGWSVLGRIHQSTVIFAGGSIRDLLSGKVLAQGYLGEAAYADGWLATAGTNDSAEGGAKYAQALRLYRLTGDRLDLRHRIPVSGQISTAICDGRVAYICGMTGRLKASDPHAELYQQGVVAVDCETGKILWNRADVEFDGRGAGILVAGRLLGMVKDRGPCMLDAATGATLGEPPPPVDIKEARRSGNDGVVHARLSSPAFWNGRLFVRGGSVRAKQPGLEGMNLIGYDLRQTTKR